MNSIKCVENYLDANKKLRKAVIFGAATAGVAAGTYIGVKKLTQLIEDKRLARYYEDEFIRQEKEEREELEKSVEEFNSRRLRREECPCCGETKERK